MFENPFIIVYLTIYVLDPSPSSLAPLPLTVIRVSHSFYILCEAGYVPVSSFFFFFFK